MAVDGRGHCAFTRHFVDNAHGDKEREGERKRQGKREREKERERGSAG